jgi:hypothetical protein
MSAPAPGRDELLVDLETGDDEGSLCELLDRLLHTGVVIRGDIVLSVADLDLVYVGVHVLAASMETIQRSIRDAHDPAIVHGGRAAQPEARNGQEARIPEDGGPAVAIAAGIAAVQGGSA